MDLDVDPYVVESEVEKDDPFGDASGATTATGGLVERDAVEDAETEIAAARFLPGPHEPTQSQAEDHCASGHIPFRSWCSECVRARGTGEQHRRRKDRRDICVFSFDYLHLDEAGKPSTGAPSQLEPRPPSRFWWQKTPLARPSSRMSCLRREWTRHTTPWTHWFETSRGSDTRGCRYARITSPPSCRSSSMR